MSIGFLNIELYFVIPFSSKININYVPCAKFEQESQKRSVYEKF